MSQLTSKSSGDGLDNKERWHWKERDLKDWINDWLMRAFVEFEKGILFDDKDARARVTTIRGDYDSGEAFLNWRKGRCFATYDFNIRLEYQGVVLMGDRAIGQGKGVVWIRDIRYDSTEVSSASGKKQQAADSRAASEAQAQDEACAGDGHASGGPDAAVGAAMPDYAYSFEGSWQRPPPGQPEGAVREPMEYELTLKTLLEERATAVLSSKIESLREALRRIARKGGKVPEPVLDADESMATWRAAHPLHPEDSSQANVSSEAATAAAAYVEDLRRKTRPQRLVDAIEQTGLEEVSLYMCDVRPADLLELLETLKTNEVVHTIDLRRNKALDDAALQPLLVGLANGLAPSLTTLKLGGTSASTVSRNMVKGLTILRKTLAVSFEE